MVVGAGLSGFLTSISGMTINNAIAIALGIAIQNIPDGAIVSIPLNLKGISKRKAFKYSVLSGIIEPIAGIITIILSKFIVPVIPYMLSFSAGAMFYVVIDELIPETRKNNNGDLGTIGFAIGFLIMMMLDLTIG